MRIHPAFASVAATSLLLVGSIGIASAHERGGTSSSSSMKQCARKVELKGAVDAVAAPTFSVGGVSITTDATTAFHKPLTSVADLQVGQTVEVKTTTLPDGTVHACSVELENEND